MKKYPIYILFLLALAQHVSGCAPTSGAKAADSSNANGMASTTGAAAPYTGPSVRLVGRMQPGAADPNAPQSMTWSNSEAISRFEGTSAVTVNLTRPSYNNTAYFNVVIDGNVVQAMGPTMSTYTLRNLSTQAHEIRLVKRNEDAYGSAAFQGFVLGSGGQFLAPTPASGRRIEVIGDSMSNGFGDLGGTVADCNGTFDNEDVTQSYGPVLGQLVDADVMVSAWSGKGVYENNDGTLTQTVPDLWLLTDPSNPNGRWDFSQYQANVVVINLGTNDFFSGTPDQAGFTGAFASLLTQVHAAYQNAQIYVCVGPMLEGDARATALQYIQSVTSAASENMKVSLVDFGVQAVDANGNGAACNYHPDLATHQSMASQLAKQIKTDMGW